MTRRKKRKFSASALLIAALTLLLMLSLAPYDGMAQSTKVAKGTANLPRIVDVGADKCIPCIMMAPILEELKKEYAGVLIVEFVDVWKNPQGGQQYGDQGHPHTDIL